MTKGLFSIVVALYGVEDYVETFLQSLERQSFPFSHLDVVIVDDESPDASYDIVKRWAEKYPNVIRHTSQKNGGPGAARNTGLDMVRNKWVTFVDPDDALQTDYFRNVEAFLRRDTQNSAEMLTTRVMIWNENQGRISDTHPLRRKYMHGERLVDLRKEPNYIQLGGASTFLKRSVLQSNNIKFDVRVRPTFEDGELIGRYLGFCSEPIVGLIPSARYLYRKRGDGSSLVQSGWQAPERYDDVLRFGYLGLLKGLAAGGGKAPVWAQNTVLYDLQWYLAEERNMNSKTAWISQDQQHIFLELLRQILSYIDRTTIDTFNVVPLHWTTREALLVRFKGHGFGIPRVFKWSALGNPVNIVYTYSGAQPDEKFRLNGIATVPLRTKTMAYDYYGENFFMSRSVWFASDGEIEVWLDGEFVPFQSPNRPGWPRPARADGNCRLAPTPRNEVEVRASSNPLVNGKVRFINAVSASHLNKLVGKLQNRVGIERIVSGEDTIGAARNVMTRVARRQLSKISNTRRAGQDANTANWATSPENVKRFRDAWVIMDRVCHADDNGEHLYRHISTKHRNVNSWFLLDRGSPDWARLSLEGFKLIAYGSREAVALILNAKFIISSDATADVQYPIGRGRYPKVNAKFIFLQHGVTMNDLSRWLNPKDISLLITATLPEHKSIAGDGSSYKFTEENTCLTGFPRFDTLHRKSSALQPRERIILLVSPTWRADIKRDAAAALTPQDRTAALEATEYARNWFALLRSDELKQYAEMNSLEIVYLPHPSFADFDNIEFPEHIRVHSRQDGTVQDLFSRSKVALTDYSSVSFDLAFIGVPLIYFQFDLDEVYSGKNNYRKGYFEFKDHGFGPIALTFNDLMEHLVNLSQRGFQRPEEYTLRAKTTFAYTDSDNSERVFKAIQDLARDNALKQS